MALALMTQWTHEASAQTSAQKKPQTKGASKSSKQQVPPQLQQLIEIAQQVEKIGADPLIPVDEIAAHQLKYVESRLGPDRIFTYEFTPRPMGDNIAGQADVPFPWQPIMGNCVFYSETLQTASARPCLESSYPYEFNAPFFARRDFSPAATSHKLSIPARWARTIPAITLNKTLGKWEGQNAYGATTTITDYEDKAYGFIITDPDQAKDLDLAYPDLQEKASFPRPDDRPLTIEQVRRLKWRLQAQIDRFDGNYSIAMVKTKHHKATFDEPYQEVSHRVYLTARILKLEILDPVSGVVVLRYPAQTRSQAVESRDQVLKQQ